MQLQEEDLSTSLLPTDIGTQHFLLVTVLPFMTPVAPPPQRELAAPLNRPGMALARTNERIPICALLFREKCLPA